MSNGFTESEVEDAGLEWLGSLGYQIKHGPEIAYDQPDAERSDPTYADVVLAGRLRNALARLNPKLPEEAIEDAYRRLTRPSGAMLAVKNRAIHQMIVDGVTVEYRRPDGSIGGAQARVVDFDDPAANDWVAVNQFTVAEGQLTRRPDVVLFVNGLPVVVVELKNPTDAKATVWSAYQAAADLQAASPDAV